MSDTSVNENNEEQLNTEEHIKQLEAQLSESNIKIEHIKRSQKIDDLLRQANTVDTETARLLVERTIDSSESDDPEKAVAEVIKKKPFLFQVVNKSTSTQAPRISNQPSARIEKAAVEASQTGKRTDLLRYLRLRRARA